MKTFVTPIIAININGEPVPEEVFSEAAEILSEGPDFEVLDNLGIKVTTDGG